MSLDGLVIHAIVSELQICVGGRIGKIHMPTAHDILIQLRAQGANRRLLLSANPTYPRVQFTDTSFANPAEAPMFCMLLRKHCEGAVIEAVEQVGMERIIRIRTRKLDELGDVTVKTLVIELMGRHSNLILLDPESGLILDGIHHVTPAISSYRVVMPGSVYTSPPAQDKDNPLSIREDRFLQLIQNDDSAEPASDEASDAAPITAAASLTPAQLLVDRFSGISPLAAAEIVSRAANSSPSALWDAFHPIMDRIRTHSYEPNEVMDAKGKSYFSVISLLHIQGDRLQFPSISECLEHYYGDKAERDTAKQRASDLLRFLQNERSKNVKKLEKLKETLEDARGADRYRIQGELLTAHLHLARKGEKSLEVVNYYDEDQAVVTIPLDPLLTPSENAQRLYKKYAKMKNTLVAVEEQIASTKEEIVYLESLLHQLDRAALSDIEEIRDELIEQGYVRDRRKQTGKKNGRKAGKKKPDKPTLTCYLSSEGIPLYVGKNNLQNEYLTNRLAQPNDTWLHTKDMPGSHVVIRSSTFGDATLNEASQLAAYFSQGKSSSLVPVDYTLIRHVRKPNGAKPGFVIYERQKTLFVTPDEGLIKGLTPAKQEG